jgi:hypothetical protein
LLVNDEARRIAVNIAKQVTRRFPPPWSVEELDACFVLIDNGQHLPHA